MTSTCRPPPRALAQPKRPARGPFQDPASWCEIFPPRVSRMATARGHGSEAAAPGYGQNAGCDTPNPPFIRSGHLTAPGFSDHRIYWEEYGTIAGEPVMVMHGGPGAGSHTSSTRFFDPQRYRVILFDQRGCGKSTPSASEDDARAALTDNTTQHLIDDVSALRHELNINGKMHVFGGSWGSTLALAYALAQPATVQTLILRGVFLCRR